MEVKDIGPVPIVDEPGSKIMVGIVTDRDLALKVVARGRDPGTTKVKEVMSKGVIACKPDDEVAEAVKMMEQWQVRRIPVVSDEGELLGIIAQGDIAKRLKDPAITQ